MYPKLKHIYKMETVLLSITTILCSILVIKLVFKLRSTLPWRVNCWFCNSNFWTKLPNRNSWTCPKCDQYNGFTKDGDYNKPVIPTEQSLQTPKVFQKTPPKNGLCQMCNINQQLKVAQLANFVPMNERNFDEEIESYKVQLEKAYRLCSPCKRVLQMKLHKEKETLLGYKFLEARTPDKKGQKMEKRSQILKSIINNTSMLTAGILIMIVSVECYKNVLKNNSLSSTMNNVKDIVVGLLERIIAILKMKAIMTFPSLENYLCNINSISLTEVMPKIFIGKDLESIFTMTQKMLGGFVCLIQIIGHVWNINNLKYTIIIDLLWSVFVISTIAQPPVDIDPVVMSVIKLTSALAVLFVYRNMKSKTSKSRFTRALVTPKKMKNLVNGNKTSIVDEEDTISLDTDDDVSLNKFGLHNLSESSNETLNPVNSSLMNGRSFTPRSDSLWSKPKLNSTFCVNSLTSKSPSSVSENVFIKPSFNKYQKLAKDDSDSELDESISSLCIGSPKKAMSNNSIFSLRKFTATPCFVAPNPINRSRPLISPSKLGLNTSWVAGGYWGSEGERTVFNLDGSRSSSQSSGFESQASSMNQRNAFSQPPSREESVCGEPMVVDGFRGCTAPSFSNYQTPQNFARISSPVFPQMQYNGHVHIPQPRFAQHSGPSQAVFSQQSYVQSNGFKAPAGLGLIKLPQANSFTSR
ncbi:uncharacterized protein LOC114354917 [Ostrinia furnacalis]|uniref:uncharacterized protein LOC114354917 n=1 Tax=Ostrinia furnacalis TaxID=93504 RepID=UPI00103D0AE9|nr:uncharacterized protein LOC114354917 [Ostrinia furnacalis]